jgi:hypothetical protein
MDGRGAGRCAAAGRLWCVGDDVSRHGLDESRVGVTAGCQAPSVMPSTSLTLSGDELRDAEYMATLIQWAQRDGYPLGERDGFPILADRDELIAAGHQVCALEGRGENLISASADVVRAYGLSGKQAQAVGVAAEEMYCPENRP